MAPIAALFSLHELAADLASTAEERDAQSEDRENAFSIREAIREARESLHREKTRDPNTKVTATDRESWVQEAFNAVALAELALELSEVTRLRVRMLLAAPGHPRVSSDAVAQAAEDAAARDIADRTRALLTNLVNTVNGYVFASDGNPGEMLRTARVALAPLIDRRAALDITAADLKGWAATLRQAGTALLDDARTATEPLPLAQVREHLTAAGTEDVVTRGSLAAVLKVPGQRVAAALDRLVADGEVDYDPFVGWVLSRS